MRVDREGCQLLGACDMDVRMRETEDCGMIDTGASVCMSGTRTMKVLGLTKKDLMKCDLKLYGADNRDINLLSSVFVIIRDKKTGQRQANFCMSVRKQCHCCSIWRHVWTLALWGLTFLCQKKHSLLVT